MEELRPPGGLTQGQYADLPVRRVTVNSIVALNMAYFRKAAGLTQEELGERIGWGKSVVSTAERSSDAKRVRNFSAEDLIDISTALGVPMAALFLPPEDDEVAVRYLIATAAGDKYATWLLGFFFPTFQGGSSPAMDAYRHRCIVAGTGRQDHILTADEVASARTDIARVKAEALLRDARIEQVEDLQRRIDGLRAFERDYRAKLQALLKGQLQTLWEGVPGSGVDQLLKDLEERAAVTPGQNASVLVLREDGTYDVIEWGPVGDDAGVGDKTSDNEGLSDHDTEE